MYVAHFRFVILLVLGRFHLICNIPIKGSGHYLGCLFLCGVQSFIILLILINVSYCV